MLNTNLLTSWIQMTNIGMQSVQELFFVIGAFVKLFTVLNDLVKCLTEQHTII